MEILAYKRGTDEYSRVLIPRSKVGVGVLVGVGGRRTKLEQNVKRGRKSGIT